MDQFLLPGQPEHSRLRNWFYDLLPADRGVKRRTEFGFPILSLHNLPVILPDVFHLLLALISSSLAFKTRIAFSRF